MCTSCRAAREASTWNQFDSLKCPWCAARLIQRIGKLRITAAKVTKRRAVVLADSVAAGLDEAQIRALVKGPLALAPEKRGRS